MRILVNGQPGGSVDPLDRGLQYGDGLFETIAIARGRPRFLDWHFDRLATGARRLGFPEPDLERLSQEIAAVVEGLQAVVKLLWTRGLGQRGYRPPRPVAATRIVAALPWPEMPAAPRISGVRVGWCRTRLGRNPALAGLKHLNRLEQVLARAEWDDDAMDEGLMQDDRDQVISATQANVFAKIGGRWVTPKLDECGVAGVMRRAFLQWSGQHGEPVTERAVPVTDIAAASALLLTNAVIGAWPVRQLGDRALPIDPVAAEFNDWLARQ